VTYEKLDSVFSRHHHSLHPPGEVTVVEVGITMPPFILAIFAVTDFGYYYLHWHTLTAATRDGIRIGALGISSSGVT